MRQHGPQRGFAGARKRSLRSSRRASRSTLRNAATSRRRASTNRRRETAQEFVMCTKSTEVRGLRALSFDGNVERAGDLAQ